MLAYSAEGYGRITVFMLYEPGSAKRCGWPGFVVSLSGGLLWCVAIVLLDYRFDLPWFLRGLLLLCMVVTVGLHAYRRLLRPLSLTYSDSQLARLVERRIPALDGRLYAVHEGLALSAHDQAAIQKHLGAEQIRTLVPATRLPRLQWVCASIALATVIMGVTNLGLTGIGVQRLLIPWSDAAWPKNQCVTG